jgi:hypothetical protein
MGIMIWLRRSARWCVPLVAPALIAAAARADDGITGVWQGTYDCAQGTTGLTLIVSPSAGDGLRALFFFYPTAENPLVPEGCFEMSGVYDANADEADFTAGRWLLRPPNFVTVDLMGDVDKSMTEMTGTVDGPGCAYFDLRRSAGASQPLPRACVPAPDFVASLGW